MAATQVLPPFTGEGDRAKRGEGGVRQNGMFRINVKVSQTEAELRKREPAEPQKL
jgi:hypothetical protein